MSRTLIGASANLDESASVHSTTFQAAVKLAVSFLREEHGIEVTVVWADDRASPEEAPGVARHLIEVGVKAVVGHFASGAALAAAPLYQKAGIPLVLPAASAKKLTEYSGVYRVCDSDDDYVEWIAGWLLERGFRRVLVEADSSAHGKSVRQRLSQVLGPDRLAVSEREADALLYSGMFERSVEFARVHLAVGHHPILLTDDAQTDELASRLTSPQDRVFVFGFKTVPSTRQAAGIREQYGKIWGREPGIYFWETVAATEIVSKWVARGERFTPVDTVLGPIDFDPGGESHPARFGCFKPQEGHLVEDLGLGRSCDA